MATRLFASFFAKITDQKRLVLRREVEQTRRRPDESRRGSVLSHYPFNRLPERIVPITGLTGSHIRKRLISSLNRRLRRCKWAQNARLRHINCAFSHACAYHPLLDRINQMKWTPPSLNRHLGAIAEMSYSTRTERTASMNKVNVIGLDLAKNDCSFTGLMRRARSLCAGSRSGHMYSGSSPG